MPHIRRTLLLTILIALFLNRGNAFQSHDWRIAPERINISVGDERTLQALDDSARELSDVKWSINDSSLATVSEQDGRLTLRAIKPGTVRVTAMLNGERRSIDVPIWADASQIPPGSTRWGMHPIGREIGDIAAVPTGNGPNMLSLEQTSQGDSYLRGTRDDGIQIWAWHLPENTKDVELQLIPARARPPSIRETSASRGPIGLCSGRFTRMVPTGIRWPRNRILEIHI